MRRTHVVLASIVAVVLAATGAEAQNVVKIGQIEAQTGADAIYGWMSSQGTALAVDEINKAGGFTVGGKTYTLSNVFLAIRL
jgi:branched-chain amino acid transport system substrate-binding protein